MQPDILANAPRCGARTRSGAPCRSPAVGGKARCRMHGGGRGSGAPRGNRNAWKHGLRSAQVRQIARYVRASGRLLATVRICLALHKASRLPARLLPPPGRVRPDQKMENLPNNPMHPEKAPALPPLSPPRTDDIARRTGRRRRHPDGVRLRPDRRGSDGAETWRAQTWDAQRWTAPAFPRAGAPPGFAIGEMVPLTGLEPVTPALRMRCSTN